jgi:hypothetical protein
VRRAAAVSEKKKEKKKGKVAYCKWPNEATLMTTRVVVVAAMVPCASAKGGGVGRPSSCR